MNPLQIDAFHVQKLRQETPALLQPFRDGGHRPIVHFNNAGAALMPKPVQDAITEYTKQENRVGSYELQGDSKEKLDRVYLDVGRLIGASNPSVEIALQESATMAWCNAFYSLNFKKGDVVLVEKQSYGACYVSMLQMVKKVGIEIRMIPSTEKGIVDVVALEHMLREDSDRVEGGENFFGSNNNNNNHHQKSAAAAASPSPSGKNKEKSAATIDSAASTDDDDDDGADHGGSGREHRLLRHQKNQQQHQQSGGELSSNLLRCKTIRLVSITHVPTHCGTVNPCEEIGSVISRFSNVLYFVDACQSAGQIPLDVTKLQCHVLSAASRKYLRGPRGCGFLYVKESLLRQSHRASKEKTQVDDQQNQLFFFGEPPMLDHFGAPWKKKNEYEILKSAKRFEKWENSPCLRLAFGEAIRYALDRVPGGIPAIWERIKYLASDLRKKLRKLYLETGKNKILLTDVGDENNLSGLVTFKLTMYDCTFVQEFLRCRYGINVVVSSRSAARIDLEERGLECVNRASVHYYNTEHENDTLISALKDLILSISKM